MGFLHSFLNSYLKHNQRRHVKMDCNELIAMRLAVSRLSCESQVHQLRNANMMGSTYILARAKLIKFFDKF